MRKNSENVRFRTTAADQLRARALARLVAAGALPLEQAVRQMIGAPKAATLNQGERLNAA